MQGVRFASLWLARAADFTMDGLISVEALASAAHGRDLCHMPWGVKGFVHPGRSPETLSQGNLHLQYQIHSLWHSLQSLIVHDHMKTHNSLQRQQLTFHCFYPHQKGHAIGLVCVCSRVSAHLFPCPWIILHSGAEKHQNVSILGGGQPWLHAQGPLVVSLAHTFSKQLLMPVLNCN